MAKIHPLVPAQGQQYWAVAVETAWCNAWASLRYRAETTVTDTPHFLRIQTPNNNDLLLNAVLRYQQERRVTLTDLETVIAPYRQACEAMQWWLRLGSEPPGLRESLRSLGMQMWSSCHGMVLPLQRPYSLPSLRYDLTIRPATTARELTQARELIARVFVTDPAPMVYWCGENPYLTTWLATMRDVPVAALQCQTVDGTLGIFNVATAEGWRRRGLATNLMLHSMHAARQQGAEIATLTAAPEAEHLYQTLGFFPVCSFEFWMPGIRLLAELER